MYLVDLGASIEDTLYDFLAFAPSLVDTSLHSIFIVLEHHYEHVIRYYKAMFELSPSTLCTALVSSMAIERYSALDSYRNIAEKIIRIPILRRATLTIFKSLSLALYAILCPSTALLLLGLRTYTALPHISIHWVSCEYTLAEPQVKDIAHECLLEGP